MTNSPIAPATVHPIVVIGAGPAGLGIGDELNRRGLRVPILERAEGVGDSWRRMPEAMKLNSPAGVNILGDRRVGFLEWPRIWNRGQYYDYLRGFAAERDLDLRFRQQVEEIRRDDQGLFELRTANGFFRARSVVNATGYFCEPVIPERPGGDETTIPCFSVPDFHGPEALRDRLPGDARRVLIVGARITAGQIAVQLHNAGFEVTISHREPIRFGLPPKIQRLGFRLYYPYEAVRLRSPAFAKRDSGHPMQGGAIRQLIEGGQVATRPDLQSFEGSRIRFVDGRCEAYDGLIWATGYRPVMRHLTDMVEIDRASGLPALREMESVSVRNLYFLGLDQQVDYTSRMLRGIRRDARWLANRLAERAGNPERIGRE